MTKAGDKWSWYNVHVHVVVDERDTNMTVRIVDVDARCMMRDASAVGG